MSCSDSLWTLYIYFICSSMNFLISSIVACIFVHVFIELLNYKVIKLYGYYKLGLLNLYVYRVQCIINLILLYWTRPNSLKQWNNPTQSIRPLLLNIHIKLFI